MTDINLERCPYQSNILCHAELLKVFLGCSVFLGLNDWLIVFAYWLEILVSSKFGLSWTSTTTVIRLGALFKLALDCCVAMFPPNPLWAGCSHQCQMYPSIATDGYGSSRGIKVSSGVEGKRLPKFLKKQGFVSNASLPNI